MLKPVHYATLQELEGKFFYSYEHFRDTIEQEYKAETTYLDWGVGVIFPKEQERYTFSIKKPEGIEHDSEAIKLSELKLKTKRYPVRGFEISISDFMMSKGAFESVLFLDQDIIEVEELSYYHALRVDEDFENIQDMIDILKSLSEERIQEIKDTFYKQKAKEQKAKFIRGTHLSIGKKVSKYAKNILAEFQEILFDMPGDKALAYYHGVLATVAEGVKIEESLDREHFILLTQYASSVSNHLDKETIQALQDFLNDRHYEEDIKEIAKKVLHALALERAKHYISDGFIAMNTYKNTDYDSYLHKLLGKSIV
jgi:hypothetical protein